MKPLPSPALRLAAVLCFALGAPASVHAANPLKSISSGLKKAGTALNPFKKSEPKPAPAVVPAPAKPKPAATAKTTRAAPVKKKKPAPASSAKKTPTAAAAATVAASSKTKPAAGEETADTEKTPDDTVPAADIPPPAPEAAPVPAAEIPFGTPVMGRKGYVRSPYADDQGMVDVTGIAAGAKVKCPFTGKVFRVP